MRKRTLLTLLLAAALFVTGAVLAAEGPIGKWSGTLETQRGSNDIQMAFEETDGELTGTWTGPRGEDELQNVAYENGTISFERHVNFQGNEFELSFSGTIEGDTMNLTMTTPRGENAFVAKRME